MNQSAKRPTRRNKPSKTLRRSKTARQSQKTGDFGQQYSPPTNPPDTTAQPWWPVVISSIRAPGDYTFTELVADFQSQLNSDKYTFNSTSFNSDSGTPFRCQFRFGKVAVWNLTGRIVSLTIWEIPEQTYTEAKTKLEENDQLGSWVDCGGPSAFPAVGYSYPSSHHRRIYRPDPRTSGKKIATTAAASGDKILYHLHIWWKSDSYPKFYAVEQPHLPIIKQIRQANDKLVQINTSILQGQEETRGNAIIKGATVAAHYIIPAVAADQVIGGATPADVAQEVTRRDAENDLVSLVLARLSLIEDRLSTLSRPNSEFSELQDPVSEDNGNV